jgi:hypothetical protein
MRNVFRFLKPFHPHLASKLEKSVYGIPIFFCQTSLLISKTPELDVDLESVEKITKNACNKSYQQKSNEKMVDIYYCVHKFSAYNFCGVNFSAFFETDSKITFTFYVL